MKALVEKGKAAGTYRELTKIESGSIGHGYNTVFGRFLDTKVTYIHIEDPYIRAFHQVLPTVYFTEREREKLVSLSLIHVYF